jgi:hypothetical protein
LQKELLNKNFWSFLTHASLILLRGTWTLTFLYTISTLQPFPCTKKLGSMGTGKACVQKISVFGDHC